MYVGRVGLRVLTWNLMHGRSVPPAGRDCSTSSPPRWRGWEWDVALLQEVPPWWPPALGRARWAPTSGSVLTSRNALLPLRRAIAVRWPDLIKSNGGGANAILVRGAGRSLEHRTPRSVLVARAALAPRPCGSRRDELGVVGRQPPRTRSTMRRPRRRG